ncbi:MAG TPA: hypothetical protein EYO84_03540 [Planctomycetes bacterium]|nr:hypothetical protein [Planctomycetota bacterium]
MNEKGDKTAMNKTAMNLAGISEFVGLIFCVLGVVSGIYHMVNSLSLGGATVLHLLTTGCFPTVAGGLLLIVAGRILRVVIDNSGA